MHECTNCEEDCDCRDAKACDCGQCTYGASASELEEEAALEEDDDYEDSVRDSYMTAIRGF